MDFPVRRRWRPSGASHRHRVTAPVSPPSTLGVILAGGLARRMGGVDKPLLELAGRPLLAHVAERLGAQCQGLIVSAHGDPARFAAMDLPVVADPVPGHQGPLAGILAALEWASVSRPETQWVVSCPGDTPFLPPDLVRILHEARHNSQKPMACASSGPNIHHAVGLWPVRLRDNLRNALIVKGLRSVREWASIHGVAHASWPDEPVDPFFNVNTPAEWAQAQSILARAQGL
jgi:molybdenum cofactor guanylyltransferase